MTTPYTLIVGAAPAPGHGEAYGRIIGRATRVIAADDGLGVCLDAGRMPDVVIGDLDSAPDEALAQARTAGVTVIRHPVDKDKSDLELALAYAREEGAAAVAFTAAFSGRLDHTLAALGTLLRSADLGGRLEEPDTMGYALDVRHRCTITLETRPGVTMSVFAVDPTTVVSIDGVRYPLVAQGLPVLSSLGLSNVATSSRQTVTLHSGSALVFTGA
ncbi:MAG: thiamine diphosphokinase [Coriobacteriia bacterium]|nr:thiamine diphosphokinase [Coriobacteriia bacterium]